MTNLRNLYKEIDKLQEEVNKYRPLNAHLRKQIKEYFRIGLTYSSNALEGNSLTESETKIVLEEGITIGGKLLKDHLEAIGHSDAFNLLFILVHENIIKEEDIKDFHKFFYTKIDAQYAGIYRKDQAIITGSKYPLPLPSKISSLMGQFCKKLAVLREHEHPVLCAAQAHKEFVFIHPFIDGNGRVARLLMNLLLMQSGYLITIIPPVIRSAYIRALEKAHTNDDDFCILIAQMVKETQKDFLRLFTA